MWVLSWGTFLWVWPKAFCLFLYMILWNVCPSALEFLLSHRGPFSRSRWADMDLLFLTACSEGAAVVKETSPYLLQDGLLWGCRLLFCVLSASKVGRNSVVWPDAVEGTDTKSDFTGTLQQHFQHYWELVGMSTMSTYSHCWWFVVCCNTFWMCLDNLMVPLWHQRRQDLTHLSQHFEEEKVCI